ncbi:MAG: RES domain-containing protein [Firmicutes bacterium]|nr:RES domain-containing protein [Bacillota bacterium]
MNINDIEEKIKMISKFLSKENIDENYENIKNIVSDIITPTLVSHVEITRMFLFRARKLSGIPNFDNLSMHDILLPPENITEIGRGNLKNKPVLYCALDPVTAIHEVEIKEEDYFLLGCFELLENHIDSEQEKTAVIGITKTDSKDDPLDRIAYGITSNFLYTEFTREITEWNKNRYYVTNAIVDHLFNKLNYRSIIYPSVINNERKNILLSRESSSDRIAFYYMYVCKIMEIGNNQFKAYIYKSLDQVETIGELKWRNLDNTRVFTYKSEGPHDQVEVLKHHMCNHFE